jgi:NADPH:quinone reductase-like Zn-dependent oxidoreductase
MCEWRVIASHLSLSPFEGHRGHYAQRMKRWGAIMKVVKLKSPASVTNLCLLEVEDPPAPKTGEVLVRLRANSLNAHDDFIVRGVLPAPDGRIPLSDGAGEVVACGEGVSELSVGDAVVSVDQVIEVGGPATFAQSMAACRLGGHIALIGVLSGFAGEVLIPALFSGQIRVSGISIGCRADQEDMIRAIQVNGLKPVIDRSFTLEQITAAY